jgi:hypothetical protein
MKGLGEDASAVQRAISERLGSIMQHTATFVVGFIIAFTKGKQLRDYFDAITCHLVVNLRKECEGG